MPVKSWTVSNVKEKLDVLRLPVFYHWCWNSKPLNLQSTLKRLAFYLWLSALGRWLLLIKYISVSVLIADDRKRAGVFFVWWIFTSSEIWQVKLRPSQIVVNVLVNWRISVIYYILFLLCLESVIRFLYLDNLTLTSRTQTIIWDYTVFYGEAH